MVRLDESMSGIFIFKTEWMNVGYAYEMALKSAVHNINNGTHEIMLNLKI
ncbi:type IX secretion system membrane protein PorP/SprF [Pareuzebyella sediminis]|nr:type IX secretion system membrane protein PorP/SprF [Pareuzebyella sediminis]